MGSSVFIDQLGVDTAVYMGDEAFRVLSANSEQLVLKREVDGHFKVVEADEFYGSFRSGSLIVGQRRDAEALLGRVQRHLAEDFDARTERELAACRRRAHYTMAYLRERPGTRRELTDLIRRTAIEIRDLVPPCPESVYGWVRLVRAADSDNRALTSIPGRRKEGSRQPQALRDLMDELILNSYMQREGPSFSSVAEELHQRIDARNAELPPDSQLLRVDRTTFLRYRDATFHPYEIDAARRGKAYADRRWAAKKRSPRPERRLDKVQIDSTVADIILVDDLGRILGRPWITAAIDVYSRVILAVVIGFTPPSVESLSQLLRMMCTPKGEILNHYGLEGEGFHGRPCEVIVDNALEFHSDLLKKLVVERLGIIVTYQPKGEPWWKAMIERWFGTYQRSLVHTLPGTTFSNPRERGDYDSQAQARLTLEDLRRLTWIWLDAYHKREHSELHATPASVWNTSAPAEGRGLSDIRDLDCLLTPIGSSTITPRGIKLHGDLWYDSDGLRPFLPSEGRDAKVDVRFDPSNLGAIYVRTPSMSRYLQVPAIWADYAEGLSLDLHKRIRESLRDRPGRDDDRRAYLDAKACVLRAADEMLGDKRTRKRDSARILYSLSDIAAAQRMPTDRAPPEPSEPLDDPMDPSIDFDVPSPDLDAAPVLGRIEQAQPEAATSRLVKAGRKNAKKDGRPAARGRGNPPTAPPDGEGTDDRSGEEISDLEAELEAMTRGR